MSKQCLVSVIVPIYKVENYLDACVESICKQTYQNLEIILVDDGSPDRCPAMCDEWEKKDSRIIAVHKTNGGLSDARNEGLKYSTGDYILYVDSDDTIQLDMINSMVEMANVEKADVVVSTFTLPKEESKRILRKSGEVIVGSAEETLKIILENGLWQAWAKLIKREYAMQCKFVKSLIYEDYENTPRLFCAIKKCVVMMDGAYIYTIRDDSIMGERKNVTSVDFAKITDWTLSLYEKSDFTEDTKLFLYCFLFKQLVYNYHMTIKSNSDRRLEFCDFAQEVIRKHKEKWLYNRKQSNRNKIAYILIAFLPCIYNCVYKFTHR